VLAPDAVNPTLPPAKMLAELGEIAIVGTGLITIGVVTAKGVHPPPAGME
jgi:hypothetical protein